MASEPRTFASLSPDLLARKGGAKPAMRPQLQPLNEFHEEVARQMLDDLGWNDMGEPDLLPVGGAQVLPIHGAEVVKAGRPEVVVRQQELGRRIAEPARPRGSAAIGGKRAAFTLRLDADRHLALRLASTVTNRSAQQLVTEALDRMLESMPDIQSLAANVRNRG